MLNTDLHRANIDTKKKGKRMSKEDFIKNLRGCDLGNDVDRDYLSKIYDNIQASPIAISVSAGEATSNVSLLNAEYILNKMKLGVLLKSDKKKNRVRNFKINDNDGAGYNKTIEKNVMDSDDLLRSLSPYFYNFLVTGVDMNFSMDIVSFLFESSWSHFHAITESLLSKLNEDLSVAFIAMDILCYCICACILLDKQSELLQFLAVYSKFQASCALKSEKINELPVSVFTNSKNLASSIKTKPSRAGLSSIMSPMLTPRRIATPDASGVKNGSTPMASQASGGHNLDGLQSIIEKFSRDDAFECIGCVQKIFTELKSAIRFSVSNDILVKAVSKLDKQEFLLEHNCSVVKDGNLTKINKAGKESIYHFYLLSDMLIYAQSLLIGSSKVREVLTLYDLQVCDKESDLTGCTIVIKHPSKLLIVVADSIEIKRDWLSALERAITDCVLMRSSMQRNESKILFRLEQQNEALKSSVVLAAGRSLTKINYSGYAFAKTISWDSFAPTAPITPKRDAVTPGPFVDNSSHLTRTLSGIEEVAESSTPVCTSNSVGSEQSPVPESKAIILQRRKDALYERVYAMNDASLDSLFIHVSL